MSTVTLEIVHEACWGCKTCEVACKQEHGVAVGVRLIKVIEQRPCPQKGSFQLSYAVHYCRHCDDPSCAAVCPEKAIRKRADGIVVLDAARCSGCQACVDACPYDAVVFDAGEDLAQKCNLCYHRLDQGLLPACADNVCPAHCITLMIDGEPVPARPKHLSFNFIVGRN